MVRFLSVFSLLISIAAVSAAQNTYSYLPDPEHPGERILLGSASKQVVAEDTAFRWYARNQKGYEPSAEIITAIAQAKDSLSFIVFAGTWCDDSQFILPRFFRLLEKAGVEDDQIRFFAVDRNKKTPDGAADDFRVERVPTIIVLVSGKETGRVIEYGKTGRWDDELAALTK